MLRHIAGCHLIFFVLLAVNGQSQQLHLHKIVGVRAENGIVAIRGNSVSIFSDGYVSILNPADNKWRAPNLKSNNYSVQILGSTWKLAKATVPLSAAFSFGLCDRLNQISLGTPDDKIHSVLPSGAKVKAVEFIDEETNLVVYSLSLDTLGYDIHVGLIRDGRDSRDILLQTDLATEAGSFCGVQGGGQDPLYILIDEPAGSSNYSAVYIYGGWPTHPKP